MVVEHMETALAAQVVCVRYHDARHHVLAEHHRCVAINSGG
jgi:hypothetical protein